MSNTEMIVLQVLTNLIMVAGGYYLGFKSGKKHMAKYAAEVTAMLLIGQSLFSGPKSKEKTTEKKVKSSKKK